MLTPEELHQEMKENKEFNMEMLRKNPWLIPATIALTTLPVAVCIHGFWKNRQLQKKLKIEREKTKQLVLGHHEEKRNYRPFKFH
ncbi:transposase [Companilactobacillus zhachilii]|jgi:hypothetical protein|uniref:Transposase n=2 Tax=Companilactobacillus zhachilii TaxID=2304606 RepID=A0A386PR22_9LACO|nr:transposase [Companilactobacillus zhachilii]AYE37782.1 transposase [Companilactobacillus zhachilii]MBL3530564.1 transposase [Companilactobacillus zhachilii]